MRKLSTVNEALALYLKALLGEHFGQAMVGNDLSHLVSCLCDLLTNGTVADKIANIIIANTRTNYIDVGDNGHHSFSWHSEVSGYTLPYARDVRQELLEAQASVQE